MKKANELRDLSIPELELEVEGYRKELFLLKNEYRQSKKIEAAHRLPALRRAIARGLTILTQKQNETAAA